MEPMRPADFLAFLAILVLCWACLGCAPRKGHLDPRKHGELEATLEQGNQSITITRDGPVPLLVEPRAKARLVDGDKRVEVEFQPRSEHATTFLEKLSSAFFGFLGGLFAG